MRTTGKVWRRQVTELLASGSDVDDDARTHAHHADERRAHHDKRTPGDWRAINNLRARVRRELRTTEGDNNHVD